MISVTIPIRTVNELNAHGFWRERQRRAKSQRAIVAMKLRTCALVTGCALDSTMHEVKLTRIAPRTLDDDGAVASQKHVRDGAADWLGIDDNDPRVRWSYAQEKGAPRYYAVRIEVRAVETGAEELAEVLAVVEKRRVAAEKREHVKLAKRVGGRKR